MKMNWGSKEGVVLSSLLIGAGLVAAIYSNWITLVTGAFVIGTGSAIYYRKTEPYSVARWLFWFALLCSYVLAVTTKDPTLRRGAWVTGLIAGVGCLVAYEMKLRAMRNGGVER
jgi:hypothetical protein